MKMNLDGQLQTTNQKNKIEKRSGMARVVVGSHSFTCHPRVYPRMEETMPASAFPAEACPYLTTQKE